MTKQELAAKIWATANTLRKNIKASEYKDYILGFMFYKYLSDKETDFVRSEGGTLDDLKDDSPDNMQYFKDKLGYFIKYDDLFSTWKDMDIKLGAQTVAAGIENFYRNLNEQYARCFYVYNKTVDTHSGIFDALDSGLSKLGENAGSRDKSVRDIVDLIDQIPPKSKDYDVLGYIYEYLIKQFSSEAKKDGAFYTPNELTTMMARILADRLKGRKNIQVYDPCIGSAGLLRNIGQEMGKYVDPDTIQYYGQDYITETSNLAKMNLFMQDIPVQNIIVRNADSLADDWPYFDEYTNYSPLFVDAVTCNPPYSQHWNPEQHETDDRFKQYGLAPAGKADFAFLLQCLYHVKPDGIMAIVLPHGVLFRGGSEETIREHLVEAHNIETIIGMPSNLFFATGIPVIVMILSKGRKEDDILFVDASTSFVKGKNQNLLKESDVQRICDVVRERKDVPHFAKLVSHKTIIENGYNLNIPRYVSAQKEDVPYDLYSVMTGEVSDAELNAFSAMWQQFPTLREKIFSQEDGYYAFNDVDVRKIVFDDPDVKAFLNRFHTDAQEFREYLASTLIYGETGTSADTPEYDRIKFKLFDTFKADLLVDKYDIYQAFSDTWPDIDSGLSRIRREGRQACRETENIVEVRKNQKTGKYEDVVVGIRGKVISLDLVKRTFFHDDFVRIDTAQAKADAASSEYEELFENLDEEDRTAIVKEDDDSKVDPKKLKAAAKSAENNKEAASVFQKILACADQEKQAGKIVRDIAAGLDKKAVDRLGALTDEEINMLLTRQWVDPVAEGVNKEAEKLLNDFVKGLQQLKTKYSTPMDDINREIQTTNVMLETMLGKLTGTDKEMAAVHMLENEL